MGYQRAELLRRQARGHAQHRLARGRRHAVHAGLCVGAALLAVARGADDRPVSHSIRPREQRDGAGRIAADRDHPGQSHEGPRIRHVRRRQMAPGQDRRPLAHGPRIRRILRRDGQSGHRISSRAATSILASRRPCRRSTTRTSTPPTPSRPAPSTGSSGTRTTPGSCTCRSTPSTGRAKPRRNTCKRFADVANENDRTLFAMTSALDDAVGVVLDKVRALGQENNTLIFFISDNGAPGISTATASCAARSTPPGKAASACRSWPSGRAICRPEKSTSNPSCSST